MTLRGEVLNLLRLSFEVHGEGDSVADALAHRLHYAKRDVEAVLQDLKADGLITMTYRGGRITRISRTDDRQGYDRRRDPYRAAGFVKGTPRPGDKNYFPVETRQATPEEIERFGMKKPPDQT